MFRTVILAALLCAALPAHGTPADEPPDPPTARVVVPEGRTVAWAPNPGPQTRILAFGGYEGLYGGAAGGGKSDALLAGGLRFVDNPRYTGIIFRRTFPDLEKHLIERSRQVIPAAYPTARYNDTKHFWRFPSGARLLFAHLEHEKDKFDHQGAEYQYIGFDELTQFSRGQYTYLLSRGRSSNGLPVRIRSSANPGGEGHEWVMERWAPWLDPTAEVDGLEQRLGPDGEQLPPAAPGQVLHYVMERDGSDMRERWVPKGTLDADGIPAKARVFVPAKLADNPVLMKNDPGYVSVLNGLDPVTRAQLKDGNWLVKPAAGLLFKRAWFDTVDHVASNVVARVRRWDFAASEATPGKKKGPDWTVGARWARTSDGLYFVEDVVRMRGRPFDVEQAVLKTAELDGKQVAIRIPQDPGSAGVHVAESYVRLLAGYDIEARPETGDKVTRAKPVSSQAERRNIKLVRGPWNAAWIAEHEAFPDGDHDDQVDTSSGAVAALAQPAFAYSIG
jgi:predicted phage terminase large subunit-like protein